MAEGMYRIAIVGASSLAGKELADELGESLLAASDVTLLDDEEVTGTIASVGDEAVVIQPLEAASFERMDFVFFAGEPETTLKYWGAARMAGASIVDMTYALEGETGVAVRAPFVRAAMGRKAPDPLDFATVAVVAAAPASVMLALVAERLQAKLKLHSLAATIFEPASEHGRGAMDELHQQTVNLLSFQNLPREHYDAQVAFNVLPSLGELAKVDLDAAASRIVRHFAAIVGSATGQPALEAQVVQSPVFHGYVASVLVELDREVRVDAVEAALEGEGIDVVSEDSDPPSNLSAAGQEDIMALVRSARGKTDLAPSRRFWLWLAADNLKLRALNAIACANEMKRLRPRGSVQ
jgi:aspartate-semialdehyde dehydrogenase